MPPGAMVEVDVDDQRQALELLRSEDDAMDIRITQAVRKAVRGAVSARDMPALAELMDAGAWVDPKLLCEEVSHGAMTPWVQRLASACFKINAFDKGEELPAMHVAASVGSEALCIGLMNCGATVVSVGAGGQKPLHMAAAHGHVELCVFLLKNGAKVRDPDKIGATPLHYAAAQGQTRVVDLLCSREPLVVNAMTDSGTTALDIAISCCCSDVSTLLMDKYGASPIAAARQAEEEEAAREAAERAEALAKKINSA